jgi:acyl-coenzyme A thioesterase PaaI-like protein
MSVWYRVPTAAVNSIKAYKGLFRSLSIFGRQTFNSQTSNFVSLLSLLSAFVVATAWIALPQQRQHPTAFSHRWNDYRKFVKLEILSATCTTLCSPLFVTTDGNTESTSTNKNKPPLSAIDFSQYELMAIPDRGKLETHAIYGSLLKPKCIERYEVYRTRRRSQTTETLNVATESLPDVVAIVTLGENLDGHVRIVHGGIIALIIDDILGFGYYAVLMNELESFVGNNLGAVDDYTDAIAVTANLNINFRAPIPSGSTFVVEATLVSDCNALQPRTNRNKFHWDVQVKSLDHSLTFCQATSLYVIPKQASKV